MKRPLFWSAISFALGEVLYFYSSEIQQKSIIIIMLFCCALIFIKKKCSNVLLWFIAMGVLGICIPTAYGCFHFENDSKIYAETENYKVYTYKDKDVVNRNIKGNAVVDDISVLINGNKNIKLKVLNSVINNSDKCGEYYISVDGAPFSYNVKIGDNVFFEGNVSTYLESTNPGEFSYKRYNEIRGIYYHIDYGKIKAFQICDIENSFISQYCYKIKNNLWNFRNRIKNLIYKLCDEDTANLYIGIILGDKRNIDGDTRMLFQCVGIAHILAISGLHISLIGGVLYKVLRIIGLKFVPSGIASIIILVLYGILTGNSMATIRAIIMLSYWFIAQMLGRKNDKLTATALALLIILLFNPNMLKDAGVLLSFAAILGIVASEYIIKNYKFKNNKSLIKKLRDSLVASATISAFTLPVIVSIYYEYSLYSVLVNILVLPLMSVVIICGIIAMFVGIININIACYIITPGKYILDAYQMLCRMVIKMPMAITNVGKISKMQIYVYYLLLIIFLYGINDKNIIKIRKIIYLKTKKWIATKRISKLKILIAIIIMLGIYIDVSVDKYISKETVIFLDVGQGDGTLIRTKSHTNIFVDGGSSTKSNVGKDIIIPALKYNGMAKVDYWFVSHMDLDHISGLIYVLEKGNLSGITIRNIVLSKYISIDNELEYLLFLANKNKVNIMYVGFNDSLIDETFSINVVHPSSKYVVEDKNNMSLCFLYEGDSMSVLMTGDVGEDAMDSIATTECIDVPSKKIDFIKIPHHGSKNSSSKSFYDKYRFCYGVISCGKNNRYNHPHEEIIELMEHEHIKTIRTDYTGAIEIQGK